MVNWHMRVTWHYTEHDMGDGDALLSWWAAGIRMRPEWRLSAYKWHYDGQPQWDLRLGPLHAWIGVASEWQMAE